MMDTTLLGLARREMGVILAAPGGLGLTGAVGDVLFAFALHVLAPDVDPEPVVVRALDRRAPHWQHDTLHHGVAGLGFALACYAPDEPLLAEIDARCASCLPGLPPASVQGGVAGIALYASLRSNVASGRRLQDACIGALAAAATPWGDGIVWHTPEWYARARGVVPQGGPITELGPVHGVGGAIVALAALARAGRPEAAKLVQGALRGIWSCERTGANRFGRMTFGRFPGDRTLELDELRWCTGDRGILHACWLAAGAVGDTESEARALGALASLAASDAHGALPGEGGRIDMCCGLAVVARVHGRMFRETREPVFDAAQARLLATCAEGVASLRVRGLAYGRAGILLALLARDSDEDPVWDAILGLRLPRRARTTSAAEIAA